LTIWAFEHIPGGASELHALGKRNRLAISTPRTREKLVFMLQEKWIA
jgi:hypothetical protein